MTQENYVERIVFRLARGEKMCIRDRAQWLAAG